MKSVFTREYAKFLDVLVEARKAADLSQQGLANKLGRPQSFVSKYERGERRLDVIEFLHVANAIGLSAADTIAKLEHELSVAKDRQAT